MSVELPKDAEGREIPLDTKVLYRKDGTLVDVDEFNFSTGYSDPEHKWTVRLMNCAVFFTTKMFLNPPEPPDSWEKLEEDLGRAIDAPKPYNYDSMTCGYFDNAGSSCQECKKKNGFDSFNCNKVAWKDILSRIRKLRGEDE